MWEYFSPVRTFPLYSTLSTSLGQQKFFNVLLVKSVSLGISCKCCQSVKVEVNTVVLPLLRIVTGICRTVRDYDCQSFCLLSSLSLSEECKEFDFLMAFDSALRLYGSHMVHPLIVSEITWQ